MISLIATVYNEVDTLLVWLQSMRAQTVPPDEIIIVDAGSTDGTWELLKEEALHNPSLKIFQEKGNIAHGRNVAINRAKGEYIVVADAGCMYTPTWFGKITASLDTKNIQFATTAFAPWFKKGDTMSIYLIAAATIPTAKEFRKQWLPSSRSVAFRKHLWESVQGYPEWLPICEDVVFDLAIERMGIQPVYIREPLVLWRPRLTLKKYCVQLFKYTRGDGHAGLFFSRQLVRYSVYGMSIALLVVALTNYQFAIVLIGGIVIYNYTFWKRWINFTQDKNILYRGLGILLVPFVIALGDVAKMCGWPVGVWERKIRKIAPTV